MLVPIHKQLQDDGQIEVITTPYAHPILPLIIDSSWQGLVIPLPTCPPSSVTHRMLWFILRKVLKFMKPVMDGHHVGYGRGRFGRTNNGSVCLKSRI